MNIGIDLDGVVFDTERLFSDCSAIYDKEINGKGLQHPEELRANKRYDWTKEQTDDFMKKNFIPVEQNAPFMPGAIEAMKKLSQAGHKLFIITARGRYYPEEVDVSMQRLKEINHLFTLIAFGQKNKVETCRNFGIDVMIDDYYKIAEDIANAGIDAIYFKWREGLKDANNPAIKTVYSWSEVEKELLPQNEKDISD